MTFTPVSAGAPAVIVNSTAELEAAYVTLSTTVGGGTILLGGEFPEGEGIVLGGGGGHSVHITSENAVEPVAVSRIKLNGVENLKVSNVTVDSTKIEFPKSQGDLDIDNCSNIEISKVVFTSNGTSFYDPDVAGTVQGGRLATIDDSTGIKITETVGSGYFHAWAFRESSDITYSNNELFGIQGDGLKMREVADVLISNNYLHDFASTPHDVTHSDFIQLHSGGPTDTPSMNVTITGNVLDTGNGNTAQGIWMRNEAYNGSNDDMLYRNITITDNLIYSASAQGIGITGADNVLIDNNTLLWNPQAMTDRGTAYQPRISVDEDVSNVTVSDNIAPIFNLENPAAVIQSGNVTVSWNSSASNFVGNHFVNAENGGDIGPEGWQLLEESPWVGAGAGVSQPGGSAVGSDLGSLPAPVDPVINPDPVIMPDPVVVEAPTPESGPAVPVAVTGNTLFAANFEQETVTDLSDYDSTFRDAQDLNIVEDGEAGHGYRIGDGRMVRLDVENAQFHSLDSFGFEMDIRLLDPTDSGRFLHFPRAFEALLEKDGSVTFKLATSDGEFSMNSGRTVFDDLEEHVFAVGYDSSEGFMSMVVDGEVVAKTAATGTTSEAAHHSLTIGTIWGNPVNAVVDDIFFGTDPLEAGVDLSLDVGEDFASVPPEPVAEHQADTPPPDLAPVPESHPTPEDLESELPALDQPALFNLLFAADFENGIEDLSSYGSDFRNPEPDAIVDGFSGKAFQISDSANVALHRSNEQIHELDSFMLRLDIQLLDPDDTGRFLHFPRAFEAKVEDDRSISFLLTTDQGNFRVNSGAVTFDDLDPHSFAVGYDSEAGRMTMEIDGEVVDSTAASGTTGAAVHHGLYIGSAWGDSLLALVDNVAFGEPQEDSAMEPEAGLLFSLLSTAVEPDVASPEGSNTEDVPSEEDLALAS